VVVALALTAAFGHVGSISIISGWFPVALFWVTVAVCLIAVVLRRDVLKEFAIGIPIGIVFGVLLFVGLHLTHTIQLDGLDSLYLWLCVACLLAGLVVAGWRRAHWPRRIAGLVAVLLAVVSAGSVVNRAFVTYPTLDSLVRQNTEQHHGIAPILVMPDINGSLSADSECVNSTKFGDVATYLAKTVPAFMQNEFNASTAPGSVAVAGLSEGGMCATTLALNNPKVFAAFGNYSGDASPTYGDDNTQQTIRILFGGSQASYNAYNPPYLLTHQRFTGLSGWFESGAQDPGVLQAARALAPLAANAGIDTCITTPPGAHSDEFWQRAFRDSLPWLSWKLNLTPQPQSIPAQCVSGKS
jgi:enterochelin esterase-like enzyme